MPLWANCLQMHPVRHLKPGMDCSIPTLVLINGSDPMHPAEYGERLAAGLVEIVSKEKGPALHVFEARKAIESFVSSLEDR